MTITSLLHQKDNHNSLPGKISRRIQSKKFTTTVDIFLQSFILSKNLIFVTHTQTPNITFQAQISSRIPRIIATLFPQCTIATIFSSHISAHISTIINILFQIIPNILPDKCLQFKSRFYPQYRYRICKNFQDSQFPRNYAVHFLA